MNARTRPEVPFPRRHDPGRRAASCSKRERFRLLTERRAPASQGSASQCQRWPTLAWMRKTSCSAASRISLISRAALLAAFP